MKFEFFPILAHGVLGKTQISRKIKFHEKSKFYGILRENMDFEFSPRPISLYLVYKESILHVLSDPKLKLM